MTVSLIPNNPECFEVGVPNNTFFDLCNTSEISNHIGHQSTNDILKVDAEKAKLFADITRDWTPPVGWYSGIGEVEGKEIFIEFFDTCNGFETY